MWKAYFEIAGRIRTKGQGRKVFVPLTFFVVCFVFCLPFLKSQAGGILTSKIVSCPDSCMVGDTIDVRYTMGGLGDGVFAYLQVLSIPQKNQIGAGIELGVEKITDQSSGIFSYSVGDNDGQFLLIKMVFYEYEDFLGVSKNYVVTVTDGKVSPYFSEMNLGKSGWVEKNRKKYYGNQSGFAVTGLQEIDGEKYYFDGAGVLQTGWFKRDDQRWHYSDETGIYRAYSMQGINHLYIPSNVNAIDPYELEGIGKDFYIICESGSYAESFSLKYCFQYESESKKVIGSAISDVDEKVKWIVSNYITPEMTEREKINRLFVWLQVNSRYGFGNSYCHHAKGVLIEGEGVCDSYASAFCLLLDEAGIESRMISGFLGQYDTTGHAWTLIRHNGQWYHADAVGSISDGVFYRGDDIYGGALMDDEASSRAHIWDRNEIETDINKVGWVSTKEATYYYDGRNENGGRVTGSCVIDGQERFFDDEGRLMDIREIDLYSLNNYQWFTLPNLKTISEESFWGTEAEVVWIPEACISIESNAFAECRKLKYIVFPDTSIVIAETAFRDSKPTMVVVAGSSAEQWAIKHNFSVMHFW